MRILGSHSALTDTILAVEGRAEHLVTTRRGWKFRFFTQPSVTSAGPLFFMVFVWSMVVIAQKFSVLLGCRFPDPLAKKSRLFLGVLLSAPIEASRLLASSAQSEI